VVCWRGRYRRTQPAGAAHGGRTRRAAAPTGRLSHGFTAVWLLAGVVTLLLFVHLLQSAALPQSGEERIGESARLGPGVGSLYRNGEAFSVRPATPLRTEQESAGEADEAGR
jgi:hypothetical protein